MLFGLIKRPGEEVVARVSEWFGREYVGAAVFGTANLIAEEFTNALVRAGFNLTGKVDTLYKVVHRIIWSALTYYGMKKLGFPELALVGSVIPVTLIGIDLIVALLKRRPEEAAEELALKLRGWRGAARTSATITVRGVGEEKESASTLI